MPAQDYAPTETHAQIRGGAFTGVVYACWAPVDPGHACSVLDGARADGYPPEWACECGRVHYRLHGEGGPARIAPDVDVWAPATVSREARP